jgi:tetrahydromethanopterin S-methyltransferase subunit E
MFEDAQLNLMNVNALQLSLEFADLVHEGYSQDSYMGTRVSGQKTAG